MEVFRQSDGQYSLSLGFPEEHDLNKTIQRDEEDFYISERRINTLREEGKLIDFLKNLNSDGYICRGDCYDLWDNITKEELNEAGLFAYPILSIVAMNRLEPVAL
ncbi:MAG: hypothetical protein P9L97_02205 [Candidatus Tenebribacter davisii]|nr:hypothetical protein [Candidatus Tenebribacter davisii]